ncbi:MAG: pyruvate kinase [Bacteroidetes bacterium]|nr:pyruvate kinase [Bacteroidota bacterium]
MNVTSRTKIIATMGPASAPKEILREMFLAGLNICRLNFSHSSYDEHLKIINTIRELNQELGTCVAILADLQGPKLRIGEVENNAVQLTEGKEILFVNEKCIGTAQRVYMTYQEFPNDVKAGEFILIDDGKLKLQVIETNRKDTVKAKVIYGGILSSKKGVNLPNTKVSLPSLTEKDIKDANFAIDNDVDWIALSFVRTATDIVDIKEIIKHKKKNTSVIAKIEKPEALKEIDNIIDLTDGIMVARGDLGVEVSFEQVPLIQKHLVQKCLKASKPVIIATQMMESMITNFRPTRAEATDVANAVIDGADCLMLSGETSTGKYPAGVIEAMHNIIGYTEQQGYCYYRSHPPVEFNRTILTDSICHTACKLAEQSNAKAIITFSNADNAAFKIAGYRPNADIYFFTNHKEIVNRMSLIWGIKAFYFDKNDTIDQAIEYTINFLKEKGLISADDMVVHVASTPFHKNDRANMLKLTYV